MFFVAIVSSLIFHKRLDCFVQTCSLAIQYKADVLSATFQFRTRLFLGSCLKVRPARRSIAASPSLCLLKIFSPLLTRALTRAKLTLDESVQHLHHFCNSLSPVQYTSMRPIYAYDKLPHRLVRCTITLPNSVGLSTRSFVSSSLWKSQRLARADAAFNGCEALYEEGLINDNLMPHVLDDEETQRVYSAIEKRPNVVHADSPMNVWADMAESWAVGAQLFVSLVTITEDGAHPLQMTAVLPAKLHEVPDLQLQLDHETNVRVNIHNGVPIPMDQDHVKVANHVTHRILYSVFRSRMSLDIPQFPLLLYPRGTLDELKGWLLSTEGSVAANMFVSSFNAAAASSQDAGLVRCRGQEYQPYIFHGTEEVQNAEDQTGVAQLMLKTSKFSLNIDMTRVTAERGNKRFHFLRPDECSVDKLPIVYSRLARMTPRIMYHIQRSLIAARLCDRELRPIFFSDRNLVLQAITSPAISGVENYERLEFLGDCVLKVYTSVNALAQNRVKLEGYLSKWKDHTVSNKCLAVISKATLHLDKYIMNSASRFKATKWRPPTNDDPPVMRESDSVSTKTLADGVEALLGAAYLEGGEQRAVEFLRLCFPTSTWSTMTDSCSAIAKFASSGETSRMPADFLPLEALIGYTFTTKPLLIEALTHPSYLSQSGNPSYQRLEFLGDAILDFVINKNIFHSTPGLPPSYMTVLRHAIANRHFLAFFLHASSMETTLTLLTAGTQDPNGAAQLEPSARRRSILDFLRHTGNLELSAELAAFKERFANLEPSISSQLKSGSRFPWVSLTALAAPKVVSDLLESMLGALAVDAQGELTPCEAWLENLGILPWLRRALADDVDVTHPKARLHLVLSKMHYDGRIKYVLSTGMTQEDSNGSDQTNQTVQKPGRLDDPIALLLGPQARSSGHESRQQRTCRIFLGEREICASNGYDTATAVAAAAEEAVRILLSKDWSESFMKRHASTPAEVGDESEEVEIIEEDEQSVDGGERDGDTIEEEKVEEDMGAG